MSEKARTSQVPWDDLEETAALLYDLAGWFLATGRVDEILRHSDRLRSHIPEEHRVKWVEPEEPGKEGDSE